MRKKRKAKEETLKRSQKNDLDDLNMEAITRNTENFILKSGIFPGTAEEIKMEGRLRKSKKL